MATEEMETTGVSAVDCQPSSDASRLEVTYEITGFDRVMYDTTAMWPGCEFAMVSADKGKVRFWEEGVTTSEQLQAAKDRIRDKLKAFTLALQLERRRLLHVSPPIVKDPQLPSDGLTLTASANLDIRLNAEVIHAPRLPPRSMPSAPLECERWILTLAEAASFEGFVEEQLRRHFLIIEELWPEFVHEFDDAPKRDYHEIRLIRNFVSHPVCEDKHVVTFIAKHFPKGIQKIDGKDMAVFQRKVTHRNFVARFEVKSRGLAGLLVEKKVSAVSTDT